MSFRVTGLDPAPFRHLFGSSNAALAEQGVKRYLVDSKPGFPDRVEVRDMEVGETALLLNYTHQPADTPYRASHAIFVREGADRAAEFVGEVPEVMRLRMISLRAFNEAGEMLDADLAEGDEIEPLILRFLGDPYVAYLHAHYAKRGCYAARIEHV
jgi:hypothetical protein